MTLEHKLPAELKREWVDALRSGDYRQGKTFLRYRDLYCCLGVLYECAGGVWNTSRDAAISYTDATHCNVLVSKEWSRPSGIDEQTERALLQKVPGIEPGLGEYSDKDLVQAQLYLMNDSEGKSFAEIADWIEENL